MTRAAFSICVCGGRGGIREPWRAGTCISHANEAAAPRVYCRSLPQILCFNIYILPSSRLAIMCRGARSSSSSRRERGRGREGEEERALWKRFSFKFRLVKTAAPKLLSFIVWVAFLSQIDAINNIVIP